MKTRSVFCFRESPSALLVSFPAREKKLARRRNPDSIFIIFLLDNTQIKD